MSERGTDFRQTAKSAVQQAKQRIGIGDPPLATEVGGRVEAVREALRAFGEGEIDRFLEAFAEDVEWVAPKGENFPGSGTREGRDSVRENFVGTVKRSYASFGFEPQRYLEAPEENWVVVLGAFAGEGVKGKGRFDAPAVQVWEFDGDAVVRIQIYTDAESFPPAVSEEEEQEAAESEDSSEGGGESEKTEDSSEGRGESEKTKESSEGGGESEKTKDSSEGGRGGSEKAEDSSEGNGRAAKSEASSEGDGASAKGEGADDSGGESSGSSQRQEADSGGQSSEREGQGSRSSESSSVGGQDTEKGDAG
jgi:ketosteroid isomerase-like protein